MDEFLSQVVERTKKIRVGDPMNPDTQMGALISEEHLHKVLDYVELGKKEVNHLMNSLVYIDFKRLWKREKL